MEKTLTQASLSLFLALAEDASNWGGTPMVDVSEAQKGNLTDLKRAKLISTFKSDGVVFAKFTDTGLALASQHSVAVY
jgi:hypothetical protein